MSIEISKLKLRRDCLTIPKMATLQEIVISRLQELGRTRAEAARRGGVNYAFINDIWIGHKRTVGSDKLERLARALDWTTQDIHSRLDGGRAGKPDWAIRLQVAREARGISPEQFAGEIGIPLETYMEWESGQVAPDMVAIPMIQPHLPNNMNIWWVMTGEEKPHSPPVRKPA
jgi:transcriptional regulator with XRE-family HTH domain